MSKDTNQNQPSTDESSSSTRKRSARKHRHSSDAYPVDAHIGTPPMPVSYDADEDKDR